MKKTAEKLQRSNKSFEERVEAIERLARKRPGAVMDTSLQRSFLLDGSVGWCLGVGARYEAKLFFYGKKIDEVLFEAEAALAKSSKKKSSQADHVDLTEEQGGKSVVGRGRKKPGKSP